MKYKIMIGTLSILMMLSTPTLSKAQGVSDKSPVLTMGQSEVVGVKAKTLGKTSHQTMVIARLRARAKKRGIESEVLQAQAKVLDINPTGLTDHEIRIQMKIIGQAKQLASLQTQAKALGLDMTGLTNEQARTKIKAAQRANTLTHLLAQAKTLGIGTSSMKMSH